MKYINSSKLDERIVRSDLDHGFREGRQFGRGRSGGQVRDEYRLEFDPGRGGWGHVRARQEAERERDQKANYEAITNIPEGASNEYKDRNEGGLLDKTRMDTTRLVFTPWMTIVTNYELILVSPFFLESTTTTTTGTKRGRDDDEDEDEKQRTKANPRFREGNEDDDEANPA